MALYKVLFLCSDCGRFHATRISVTVIDGPDRLNIIHAVFPNGTGDQDVALAEKLRAKFAYLNGGLTGSPRDGNKNCTTVAAAPVLPVGYVVSASQIADRRM